MKRLLITVGFFFALAGVARPTLLVDPVFVVPSAYGCLNSGHAAAFLARTSGLDGTHVAAYTALLNGLDADALSCKIDVLHIYATQDSATSLLNLIQNAYNGVANGGPSFTVDRGYTGTDSSAAIYINIGFNATTAVAANYTLNNAHLSAWQIDNRVSTGPTIGVSDGTTLTNGNAAYIALRSSFISAFNWEGFASNQDFSQTLFGNIYGDSRGHFVQSRAVVGSAPIYRNGVADGRAATNTSNLTNANFYSLGGNFAGTAIGSGGQIAMISIGGNLSASDVTNFYNRLRTYMTAVGVP